ncbi:MAG: acetyl-CoA carboxylase biotin carboxylase subunit [candidate division Zixibacteria bacterium]|nr:acetyl-CoA carboxylase biotin carboxylase subunit [candidate division Zixibacteria bacterium]
MFNKILIANRGEIALRVIRACRELGIKTVAVYSEADRASLHVRFADEDVCIGPAPSASSYLDAKRIISAAEVTNADAIHPGYGFLAENADFAEICESCGITFIGPKPEMIRKMGNKNIAKQMMRNAGIPVIPGSEGIVKDIDEARSVSAEIGYPVMVKAVAGGGGRGMRYCLDETELETNFSMARAEAEVAFKNPDVYIEKAIVRPHHVEIQLMGDSFGNIIHFGERDCSIQRRHQKLVEECPSPIITPEMRAIMGRTAVLGAANIQYLGAGTIEFLVDADLNFYFMEMNTRIQVEHPITEEATDIDLVKEQIRVAAGEKLSYRQEDVILKWHAIECRINAEDPEKDFRPTPGEITSFHVPGGHGIRVDTAAYAKYIIPPFYDSMIAKLIVRAQTRRQAIEKMKYALEEFIIEGIPTTIGYHKRIFNHPDFIAGNFDTSFIQKLSEEKKEALSESTRAVNGDK